MRLAAAVYRGLAENAVLEAVRRVPSLVKAQTTRPRQGRRQRALPRAVTAAVYRGFAENAVLEVVRRVPSLVKAQATPAAGPEPTRIATRLAAAVYRGFAENAVLEVVRRVPSLVKAQATRPRRGRSQRALPRAVAAAVYRGFAENAVLEVARRVLRWSRRRRRACGRAEATCARLSPRVARRATCRQGNRQPCAKIMNAHGCNRPAIRRGRRINYREGDGRQARRIFPCSG